MQCGTSLGTFTIPFRDRSAILLCACALCFPCAGCVPFLTSQLSSPPPTAGKEKDEEKYGSGAGAGAATGKRDASGAKKP